MNILFVHDHKIKKDENNNYYTGGGLGGNNLIKKYGLNKNDNLMLYTRSTNIKKEEICKFMKLDDRRIVCKPSKYYKKPLDCFIRYYKIYNELDLNNIDACVIRIPSILGNIAYKKAKKMNIPIYLEVVACPWDSFWNLGIKGKILAPIMFYKTKKIIKDANYVQYVSDAFLQSRYKTMGKNIGCSDVILQKFDENVLKRRIKRIESKKLNEKIVLGTLAAIDVEYKGQKYVLKSLARMKKEGINNFEYQLVGSGNSQKLLKLAKKLKIEEQVIIKGTMLHEYIFSWLESIDIYIQPSNQEGLCRALVEAMSMACPCIVSNAGGNPELIENEYVFKRKNVKDLSNKIKLLSSNSKKMLAASENNFQKSKEFDKTKLDKKRNNFYKKFILATIKNN